MAACRRCSPITVAGPRPILTAFPRAPSRGARTIAGIHATLRSEGQGGVILASVLRLASLTSPAWTAHALAELDEVLLDHAHLEKKAAEA